ncbi:dihydropyrimidinase-related protein 5a [Syngnathus scovelli]|uniref:dihydropyrimidinase-related protein 5a n=1 Tax=Syngnathus scovelli TaxID=161590 RepID=UPI00210F3C84|nr:dihydropyrimidinase-related protein 5a [Syngnathus scovelli]XP_049595789.1 dihydropyrimidinase-related protein 5a [Syngnathus scovelli]
MTTSATTVRILIKGGKVVNDDCTQEADVYIENGVIQQVGKELMIPGGAKVVDASGKLVMPGGIDTSVHLEETFMNAATADDFYSGTKAALAGGTTMVIAHVLPDKNESLLEAFEQCRSSADAKTCCDYALHVGVTWWGLKVRAEMEKLVREKGVNSFQMFMAYKDMYMLKDNELFQALQHCKDIGAIARVHAENGELVAEGAKEALELGISGPEGIEISRPEELEAEATHRAITIANRARCPIYLVNVSSMAAGDVVATAKMQGRVVYGETTTAHAVLNGAQYYHQDWAYAAGHVTLPPLRLEPSTPNYLMSLLGSDTLSVIGSDHRPFTTKQKAMGKDDFTKIPHGVPGVQDRMSVIWEKGVIGGKIDENRFVAVTSSNAAKIYNLYPRKGRIIPGADADVVVWDPEGSKIISVENQMQGGDMNLYEGLRCHGVPLVTISRGRLVYENGMFTCAEGSGKFCPLRTFPDYLYKKMVQREKCQAAKRVEREPYTGDVVAVANAGKRDVMTSDLDTPTRPCTRHGGVRDLQESSFSLSGAQIDDKIPKRSSARILAPPGGRSSGIW